MSILIVEDDHSCTVLIQTKLSTLGVDLDAVTIVTSLKAAKEIIEKRAFDLIFLDIFFPATVLEDTLAFIQTHPNETIIVMSNADDPHTILECTKAGIKHFISKAFWRTEDFRRALEYAKG